MTETVGIIAIFAWFLSGGASFGAMAARDEEPKTFGGAIVVIFAGPTLLGYAIGRVWMESVMARKAKPDA